MAREGVSMNSVESTVCFFKDLYKTLSVIPDADAGSLMKALFAHANGLDPEFTSEIARALYVGIADQMDRVETYRKNKAANRRKPSQSGTTENKTEQSGTKRNETAQSGYPYPYPNRKESILTDTKEKKFTPPTVEEVAAYASEKGYHMEAERFVDFYASKGWKVGNTPMKDWKAAVRNWATRDNTRKADKPVFNFDQRGTDYDAILRNMG